MENYAYSLRNTLKDEKVSGKISEEDKSKLNTAIDNAVNWLDSHPQSEKEEYDSKQKELEGIAMPIMTKLYQSAGGAPGGPTGGFPGADPSASTLSSNNSSGPRVEEVD